MATAQHTTDRRSSSTQPSVGGLLRNGVMAMIVLTGLANATNYASSVVFSRVLGPASFGDLTALLALLVILAIPTGAAQTVLAERVAVHRADGRMDRVQFLVRHALAHFALIGVVAAVLYAAAIPLVVSVLDLQAPGPAIALVALLALTFVQPLALGLLQGTDRFVALGVLVLAIAVSRIAFGVPWAEAGGGAGGAIAGQALGVAVCLAVSAWLLRDLILPRGSGAASSGLRRRPDVRAISASVAFIAFAVISNFDLLLAKIFLSSDDVGIYAAIATIGKLVMFLPLSVALVMVPNAARAHHTSGESARVLRIAALLVLGTTAVTAVPAVFAPTTVVDLMFGSEYSAAHTGVLPIVFAGGGLALIHLLVVYSVAIHDRRWYHVLILGVVLQVAGIAAFHSSPAEIATVQAVVVGLVLIVNERWFHSMVPSRRRADT